MLSNLRGLCTQFNISLESCYNHKWNTCTRQYAISNVLKKLTAKWSSCTCNLTAFRALVITLYLDFAVATRWLITSANWSVASGSSSDVCEGDIFEYQITTTSSWHTITNKNKMLHIVMNLQIPNIRAHEAEQDYQRKSKQLTCIQTKLLRKPTCDFWKLYGRSWFPKVPLIFNLRIDAAWTTR